MTERHSLTTVLAIGAAAVALACSPTVRATSDASPSPYASPASGDAVDKARAGADKAGEKIKEGAEKTGEVAKDVAHEVKHDAKPVAQEVGHKVEQGAHKTGQVLDSTKQHLDVKAALLADKTVDASHIDIKVDQDSKTLYLRGTVPTAAQKATAERIARDKAGDYFVRNELTVMVKP
jgi:hypothetical protein